MDKRRLHAGFSGSSAIDAVARHARARARTRELALIAGRAPSDISQGDYEQAKHELLGTDAAGPVATDGLVP